MPRCHAMSKQSREQCKRWATPGKEVCVMHGSKSLMGPANGNYRNGRYSKSLPLHLATRYEEARANPRLLSLMDDMALLEARLTELLAALDAGETGPGWQALEGALTAFRSAMGRRDGVGMDAALTTMEQLVAQGRGVERIWEGILGVLAERRHVAATEMKTLQGLQQMITVQQHMLMIGAQTQAVVEAVKKHADMPTGRKILQDVQAEFTRLATLEERR